MLVMERYMGESIKIGEVTVRILRAQGRVRIGIDAPKEIPIERDNAKCTIDKSRISPPLNTIYNQEVPR